MTEITIRKNCKLRKAKGQIRKWYEDNNESLKNGVIIIGCIWIVITLLMWGFTQKTVTVQQCANVTDKTGTYYFFNDSFNHAKLETQCINDYGGWNERYYDLPCKTNTVCNKVSHQEYYTLIEIFRQQWDISAGIMGGSVGWVFSHPVI
jgi:hypothetical protein